MLECTRHPRHALMKGHQFCKDLPEWTVFYNSVHHPVCDLNKFKSVFSHLFSEVFEKNILDKCPKFKYSKWFLLSVYCVLTGPVC